MRLTLALCLMLSTVAYGQTAVLPPSDPGQSVTLTWQEKDNSDPHVGFNLYKGQGSNTPTEFDSTTALTYSDTSNLPGQSYLYYVTAYDADNVESAPSNTYTVSFYFIPFAPVLVSLSAL